MGPGDHVGAGVGDRVGRVARLGLDHDRVGEEGRAGGRLGELLRELAVGEVQGAVAHEPGGGGVPEGGGAAVAERDLVAVGQAEELAEAVADAADQVADRRLAVRGAHQRRLLGELRAAPPGAPSRGRSRSGRRRASSSAGIWAMCRSSAATGGDRLLTGAGGPRRRQAVGRIRCRRMSETNDRSDQGRRLRRRQPRATSARARLPQDPQGARRDRLRRQRDRPAALLRDRQPLPRRAGGAVLPAQRPGSRSSSATAPKHELEPGGLAWVDASTVRKVRNLSDSEDAVYVVVGGKDGYVGRDGKLPRARRGQPLRRQRPSGRVASPTDRGPAAPRSNVRSLAALRFATRCWCAALPRRKQIAFTPPSATFAWRPTGLLSRDELSTTAQSKTSSKPRREPKSSPRSEEGGRVQLRLEAWLASKSQASPARSGI